MLGALAIFALLGTVVSQTTDCCSIEDRRAVSAMWNDIWSSQYTGRRVKFAQAIFEDLYERFPAARDLFERVNVANPESAAYKAHCVRVVNGLDSCINLLEDPSTLNAQLAHLSMQHVARKTITQTHFRFFHESFMAVMPQMSSCFNGHAWGRCFAHIARGIAGDLPE